MLFDIILGTLLVFSLVVSIVALLPPRRQGHPGEQSARFRHRHG